MWPQGTLLWKHQIKVWSKKSKKEPFGLAKRFSLTESIRKTKVGEKFQLSEKRLSAQKEPKWIHLDSAKIC